jgi:hypothetical protein
MKASPRCPQSACKALCLKASRKFLPHYAEQLRVLEETADRSPLPAAQLLQVIRDSPQYHSKHVNDEAVRLDYDRHIYKATTRQDIGRVAYDMFFNSLHEKGAARDVLVMRYRERWCSNDLIRVKARPTPDIWHRIGSVACKNLLWLGKRVPSRVHLANIRLHYNGWHTARRYQRRAGSICAFCNAATSEDSIQHILKCEFVHNLSPNYLKKGSPPHIPVKYVFLFGLDGKHKIAFGLMVFALYTMHNELRHRPTRIELRQCIMRIAGEIHLQPSHRNMWEEVFGWQLQSSRPTQPRSRQPSQNIIQTLQRQYPDKDVADITMQELAGIRNS